MDVVVGLKAAVGAMRRAVDKQAFMVDDAG